MLRKFNLSATFAADTSANMEFSVVSVLLLFFFTTSLKGWEVGKNYRYAYKNEMYLNSSGLTKERHGILEFKWESGHVLTGQVELKIDENQDPDVYQFFPNEPFQATFQGGQISELKVSSEVSSLWHVEIIRGVVGLLQIHERAETENNFSVVEETVAGRCTANYYKTRVRAGVVLLRKWKDYKNCEYTPSYTRGVYGTNNYDALMKSSEIVARDSYTKMYLRNGHEINKVQVEETIKIKSGNSTVEFLNTVNLVKLSFGGEEKFNVENLTSVGGVSYKGKFENLSCVENSRGSDCGLEYYMNPKEIPAFFKGCEVYMAKNLVFDIFGELGKAPSGDIVATNVLDNFSNLINVIRGMNLEKLQKTTKILDDEQLLVFETGIAQAGTVDSLRWIRILKKEQRWNINRLAINHLPETVHPLSLEYLETFFEFATDEYIMENDFDFSKDLLLAFGDLIRRYLTEKEKPFAIKDLEFLIATKYRKYLMSKLYFAWAEKDDLKFQIYAGAIGNMAEICLMNSFYPFVKESLTSFQKTLLINLMDKTIEIFPEQARSILADVYEDDSEPVSVRVAAVLQLFKTKLPEENVYDIVHTAKLSGDGSIKKAVKSAFQSKAFNYHASEKMNKFANDLKYSEQSRANFNGYTEYHFKNLSDSNDEAFTKVILIFDDLLTSIFDQINWNRQGFQSNFKLGVTVKDLSNLIEHFASQEALNRPSANIDISSDFTQIFLPFENLDTDSLKTASKHFETSFLTMNEVEIAFPTESGFPFLYSYRSPKLFMLNAAANIKNFSLDFLASVREQTSMGFVDPLVGKYYVEQVETHKEIHLPFIISHENQGNLGVISVVPSTNNGSQRLVHLETVPYVGIRDLYPTHRTAETSVKSKTEHDFHSSNFGNLRVKISPPKKLNDRLKTKEWDGYLIGGPFGRSDLLYHQVNVFLENDNTFPTSLIIKYDFSIKPLIWTQKRVLRANIFEGSVDFPGAKNHSISVTLRRDALKPDVKFLWRASYSENDEKQYEVCFDNFFKGLCAFGNKCIGNSCLEENAKLEVRGEIINNPETSVKI